MGGWVENTEKAQDISQMSFEQALAELETIVRRLEDGTAKLDEAISAYERGASLKRHCEARLEEAQTRVDKIIVSPNARVSTEPAGLD